MMVFPYPMDLIMVFPYPMDLMAYGSYDGLLIPYNGPIPYQWPALLSSPPALLSYSFGLCPCLLDMEE